MNILPWRLGLRLAKGGNKDALASFIVKMAITGLALGVALLITVLSVMNGFDREVRTRLLGIAPHITLHSYGLIDDWRQLSTDLADEPGVEAVSPFIHIQGMLVTGAKVVPSLVYAVDPDQEQTTSDIARYVDISVLTSGEAAQRTMVLGSALAHKLGVERGQTIKLLISNGSHGELKPEFHSFQVLELFDTGTELDQGLALIHINTAQDLLEYGDQVQGLRVKVDDVFNAPYIAYQLSQALGQQFYSRDWTQTFGNLYHAVKLSKRLVLMLLVVIIGVAAFNIIACMTIIVRDKAADIAILRSLGLEQKDIAKVFVALGLYISFIGVVLGVCFGLLLGLVLPYIAQAIEWLLGFRLLSSEVYPIDFLPSDVRFSDILLLCIASFILCLLAAWLPARRAAKTDPAAVLKEVI